MRELTKTMISLNIYPRQIIYEKTGDIVDNPIIHVGNRDKVKILEENIINRKSTIISGDFGIGKFTSVMYLIDKHNLNYIVKRDFNFPTTNELIVCRSPYNSIMHGSGNNLQFISFINLLPIKKSLLPRII